MNEKQKSGSNLVCEVLFEWPISKRFTAKQLLHEVHKYYPDITEGVVSGFITRAKEKGVIDEFGRQRGNRNKSAVIYRLVRKVGWDFHGPGIGSLPGRVGSYATTPHPQKELPLMPADPITETIANEQGIPVEEVSQIASDTWPHEPEEENAPNTISYDNEGITAKLINIAYEVLALETRPQLSLADFTSEELIEELRRRIK